MFLRFEETLQLLTLCGTCHMYEDDSVSYEISDVHAAALNLRLRASGSRKPSESCVFSMSILLLRRTEKYTHIIAPKSDLSVNMQPKAVPRRRLNLYLVTHITGRMLISNSLASVLLF